MLCERIYQKGCAYSSSVALALIRHVCAGCGAAFCASQCVCMCVLLLSPSICISRDRSLASLSSPRRCRRGGHSKQTQNSHPHAYTLSGGMPIADLRWGRCGLQMPQTHACTHTHVPFPSSEAAKTHSDSTGGGTPTLQHEASQLTTHTQIHLLSLSVSANLLIKGGLCILELMFSPSAPLYYSLSFSRSEISMSPCSLGLVILPFPLCSSRWPLWITAVAFVLSAFTQPVGFLD